MAERLDIILFGVTGFTGKYALSTIEKLAKKNGRHLTYGVAGRDRKKIENTLEEVEKLFSINVKKVPIFEADVSNEESLRAMAKQARVIVNCCGPYRFYGEPVVKACIEEGTHHVDVSGEPQYMEGIQLKYHKAAEQKGVYIVSACGLDSIPADLGVIFLKNNFPGTLHSVQTYLEFIGEGQSTPGPSINYGTWKSAVYGLAHADELKSLRSQLFPTRLPSLQPYLALKKLHKTPVAEGWALPFPGSDRSVIMRTQRHYYEQDKERPIHVQTYFMVKSWWNILVLMMMGSVFSMFTKFEFGRTLLLKYPHIFSLGMFSHEPPSHEKVTKSKFRLTLSGEGWKEKQADPLDQYTTPPDTTVICTVEGSNPGYGATSICLVLSAIVTITETDALPSKGGVYSPGAAFGMTSLISQLDQNGVTFRIISDGKQVDSSAKL